MGVIDQGAGNQGGDQTYGDVAGQNIYKGIPADVLLRHLDGERQSRDAFAASLERLWQRLDAMERERRQFEQDAAMERGIGMEARIKQQQQTSEQIAALGRQVADLRFWFGVSALVLLAVVIAIGALLVDRYLLAAAVRVWYDALPTLGARP